jgi:hypothetical protein
MSTFQERVITEKQELDAKIERLLVFIQSPKFGTLPEAEQKRLRRQEVLMELYSDVLSDRIVAFGFEGADAYQRGKAESDCPYGEGSSEREGWLRGWKEESLRVENLIWQKKYQTHHAQE